MIEFAYFVATFINIAVVSADQNLSLKNTIEIINVFGHIKNHLCSLNVSYKVPGVLRILCGARDK